MGWIRNLKDRFSNEWSEYTTRDFYQFVGNIGGSSLIGIIFIMIMALVIACVGLYAPVIKTTIMLQWLVIYVGNPLLVLLLSCAGITKYIERWHRRLNFDSRFWTAHRLDKLGDILFFTFMTCLIIQLLLLIPIILPIIGTSILTAEGLIYATAFHMMAVDLFWMPFIVVNVTLSGMFTVSKRMYDNVVHIEYVERINRVENDTPRRGRRGTSYVGEPTEDELLDYKLERLGL